MRLLFACSTQTKIIWSNRSVSDLKRSSAPATEVSPRNGLRPTSGWNGNDYRRKRPWVPTYNQGRHFGFSTVAQTSRTRPNCTSTGQRRDSVEVLPNCFMWSWVLKYSYPLFSSRTLWGVVQFFKVLFQQNFDEQKNWLKSKFKNSILQIYLLF